MSDSSLHIESTDFLIYYTCAFLCPTLLCVFSLLEVHGDSYSMPLKGLKCIAFNVAYYVYCHTYRLAGILLFVA